MEDKTPLTRVEQYLAAIAGGDNPVPDHPLTRIEEYLNAILQQGGGSVDPDEIRQIVEDWLAEHIDPDTGYVIDDTFTVENAAPDSKRTGQELNSLKSAISKSKYIGLYSGSMSFSSANNSYALTSAIGGKTNEIYEIVLSCSGFDASLITDVTVRAETSGGTRLMYGSGALVQRFTSTQNFNKLYIKVTTSSNVTGTCSVSVANVGSIWETIADIESDIDTLGNGLTALGEKEADDLAETRKAILAEKDGYDVDTFVKSYFENLLLNPSTGQYSANTHYLTMKKPMVLNYDLAVNCYGDYRIALFDADNLAAATDACGLYIPAGMRFIIQFKNKVSTENVVASELSNITINRIDNTHLFDSDEAFIDTIKSQLVYREVQRQNLLTPVAILAQKQIYVKSLTGSGYNIVVEHKFPNEVSYTEENALNYHVRIQKGELFTMRFNHGTDADFSKANVFKYAQLRLTGSIKEQNKDQQSIISAIGNKGYLDTFRTNQFPRNYTAIVFTDIHADLVCFHRIMDYINEVTDVDAGICLGDMMGDNYYESDGTWYTGKVNQCKIPFYTVIGNHDTGNTDTTAKSTTVQNVFEKFIEPTLDKIGIDDLTTTYYSKTFADYNLVLIVLNDYDTPDTTADGKYTVSRGEQCYSQDQIDWLISTLNSVPEGYTVCILQHYIDFSNTAIQDKSFSDSNGIEHLSVTPCYTDIIAEIVDAWMNGTALTKDYEPIRNVGKLPTLSVSADYTLRGDGIFAGYICGHTHKDFIGTVNNFPDQNIIVFSNACMNVNDSDMPRAMGTNSEDMLTAISFDTTRKRIYIDRIGAKATDSGTFKTLATVSYDV